MSQELWQKTAQTIVNAGQLPIPISQTMIEIMRTIMTPEQAEFVQVFTKPMNMEELQEVTRMDRPVIDKLLVELMHAGVLTGIPSKGTGTLVYRLLPPLPGILEYVMMRGETTEKEKKLAGLFDRLSKELGDLFQANYDDLVEMSRTLKPFTRVIPIERQMEEQVDTVLPLEDVYQIVDKYDPISVVHCYCRHEKNLLGKTCQVGAEKENCLHFGQTAKFVIDHKFGREITKDEAKKILEKAAADGLVHKTFHEKQDIEKDEYAICNCCKCCCGTFEMYHQGAMPAHTYSTYVANVDLEACTDCGTCVDMCPMEAVQEEDITIDREKCIGCGVCAANCPADAISLEHTGKREVFVPPPKMMVGKVV
jgi:formate hydrogenlyase subunit 6/NADH:ubiquinone oxidoreductase subunit I